MPRSELKVYPLEQWTVPKKGASGPIVEVVSEGRVVGWHSPAVLTFMLRAALDKRNGGLVDATRRKFYLKSLYTAASRLDIPEMRRTVQLYPDMVPQAEEVLALSDDMFQKAAMHLTQGIWL